MAAGGCGPAATLDLIQPHLSGWQQHLHLTAESAWWSPGEKDDRLLIEFPPPGATTGRPLVLLYMRWPAGQSEPAVAAAGPSARGFFIQIRGQYAGLSTVVGGSLVVQGYSQSPSATRKMKIDLRCEDGSSLIGTFAARRNDRLLTVFETERRPADVRMLIRGTSPPATGTSR
jgi:hypothetical protein